MIKVGIIGCGFMGLMHANCYKNIDGVEIAAIADARKEKAEELNEGINAKIYADGIDLINDADVDVIDICLPTYMHDKYAIAAMDKVKYLFIEKPVALTAEQADAMLIKAKETGCNVQIGQVIRFWDEYVELKKIFDGGKIGRVVNANFRRISPRPTWGWNDWLLKPEFSGGAGLDMHIHDVDYVLSLFGEPENFYTVKNVIEEKNSYINTVMQYADKAVTVESAWGLPVTHPFEATFRVVFEKATVENAGGKFMLYTNEKTEEIVIEKKEFAGEKVDGGNISDLGGYYNELSYFINRVKSGEKIEKATLNDAVNSLKFVLKELAF